MTHHVQGVENTGGGRGEIFEGQSPTNTGPKNLYFLINKKKQNINY